LPESWPCVKSLTQGFCKYLPIGTHPAPGPAAEFIMHLDVIKAVILGIVEGLTEFIPVSSTGHLLLVGHFFGFDDESFGKSFDVLIQLGAILALLSIYFTRLWELFLGMFTNPEARRFVIGVLIAFLPAMVIGALAYGFIKSVLFNVWIVCTMLVIGGFVLLWIDRLDLKPRYHDATKFSLPMYLGIGFVQCLSMVPGVSRSGASIVAAMLFGADKRAATEFSFWLAMPTMVGAFAFEAFKSRHELAGGGAGNIAIIAIGFAVSFVCGWFVVKTLLGYVSRHGFALFAWWRIIVGALGLIALALGL
jgi:undecaprenyl-diphosphatase